MEGDRGNATAGQAGSPISIHALRVEGDGIYQAYTRKATRFLSTPSGWRATVPRGDCAAHVPDFYPRPPGGGRPCTKLKNRMKSKFLSTPSEWRATVETLPPDKLEALFLSTPSEWRATESIKPTRVRRQDFYPRPPGGGRLYRAAIVPPMFRISIHALRVEGDWTSRTAALTARYFYPRPPGGGRPAAQRLCARCA